MSDETQEERPAAVVTGASYQGLLTFRGRARVDGLVEGDVVAEGRLVIGPRGHVRARIEVDELVVGGVVEGDVHARDRIELEPSARVVGDLRAPRLSLADGCVLEGRCTTADPEP